MKKINAKRRFESVNISDPADVRALDSDHPAMLAETTLFPTTIAVDGKQKLLISARENRKIGHMVTKGPWRAFPIYTLTLTERETCPKHCHMLATCYGNAMPFARRNTPGKLMEAQLERELDGLAKEHFRGFVVRLHVLGDFYSEDYVEFWRGMLRKHKALRIYGYTAHRLDAEDATNRIIAEAIANLKCAEPERFAIRWSHTVSGPERAVVIDRIPEGQRVAEGFVCPAEMDKAACCASCGLCWSPEMAHETIVFIRHGMGASKNAAIAKTANKSDGSGWRQIAPIPNLVGLGQAPDDVPEIEWVDPTSLQVEESYQRDVTAASMQRIRKIVTEWDWAHYGVPNVMWDPDTKQKHLVDGQHTMIAAATLGIPLVPILKTTSRSKARRARAFVARNDDRTAVTNLQKHHSNVVGEDPLAMRLEALCRGAGIKILKSPAPKWSWARGETVALSTLMSILAQYGDENAARVLRAVAGCAPIRADDIKAAAQLLLNPVYRDGVPEALLTKLYLEIPGHELVTKSRQEAATTGMRTWEAQVVLLYRRIVAER